MTAENVWRYNGVLSTLMFGMW